VNSRVLFRGRDDYLRLLPGCLVEPFTNRELALSASIPLGSARQITYCLRKSGILRAVGTKGRALAFQRVQCAP
jgi:hypothetical protein